MIKINEETGGISYTENDTFRMIAYQETEGIFEEGTQLRFIIAKTEVSEYIIDKTFNLNDDMTFTITLTDAEKKRLILGDYIYKATIIKNNTIVTRKSGDFTVKWGA